MMMTLLLGLTIRAASEHTALTVGPDMDILKIYGLGSNGNAQVTALATWPGTKRRSTIAMPASMVAAHGGVVRMHLGASPPHALPLAPVGRLFHGADLPMASDDSYN